MDLPTINGFGGFIWLIEQLLTFHRYCDGGLPYLLKLILLVIGHHV